MLHTVSPCQNYLPGHAMRKISPRADLYLATPAALHACSPSVVTVALRKHNWAASTASTIQLAPALMPIATEWATQFTQNGRCQGFCVSPLTVTLPPTTRGSLWLSPLKVGPGD